VPPIEYRPNNENIKQENEMIGGRSATKISKLRRTCADRAPIAHKMFADGKPNAHRPSTEHAPRLMVALI
jgi:hypothetical protein